MNNKKEFEEPVIEVEIIESEDSSVADVIICSTIETPDDDF